MARILTCIALAGLLCGCEADDLRKELAENKAQHEVLKKKVYDLEKVVAAQEIKNQKLVRDNDTAASRIKELESLSETLKAHYREYLVKFLESQARLQKQQVDAEAGKAEKDDALKAEKAKNAKLLKSLARYVARIKELDVSVEVLTKNYREYLKKYLEAEAKLEKLKAGSSAK